MKRVLADQQCSIYQICPAYRGGETGIRHRIEFQILEWYRCDFNLAELMDDLLALLNLIARDMVDAGYKEDGWLHFFAADNFHVARREYRTLFEEAFNLNPHSATIDQLARLARAHDLNHLLDDAGVGAADGAIDSELEDYLDGLFASVIEPGLTEPTLVFDYPACQAALSQLEETERGDLVADRFEFYLSGMEVANAYHELLDAAELRDRIKNNNDKRARRGLNVIPEDKKLLEAMNSMPACSGIALGIDRLLMALMGRDSISEVMHSTDDLQ